MAILPESKRLRFAINRAHEGVLCTRVELVWMVRDTSFLTRYARFRDRTIIDSVLGPIALKSGAQLAAKVAASSSRSSGGKPQGRGTTPALAAPAVGCLAVHS